MDLTVWPHRNLAYHLGELHRSLLTWRQWAGPSARWPRGSGLRLAPNPRSGEVFWRSRRFTYRLSPSGVLEAFTLPETGPDFDFPALLRDIDSFNAKVTGLTQDLQESQLHLGLEAQ